MPSRNLTRLLIALYPRRWRQRYGEELGELVGSDVDWRIAMDIVKSAISERGRQSGVSYLFRVAKLAAASAAIVLMLIWIVTAFDIITFAHRTPTLGDLARATTGAIVHPGFQKVLTGLFVLPMLLSILLATLAGGIRWTRARPRLSTWVVRLGAAVAYLGAVLALGSPQRIIQHPLPLLAVGLLFVLVGLVAEWALLRGRLDPELPAIAFDGPPS